MIEIRFHGAGGHGAVMASKLLADAAAENGSFSQSFASYGALRRGGKVESYVRISDKSVRPHCKMYEPDCVVVMDEDLIHDETILSGLKKSADILINSSKSGNQFKGLNRFRVSTVDAYRIAKENGLVLPGGMPVINTAIIGAIAGIYPIIRLEDLKKVIQGAIPKPGKNIKCAEEAYNHMVSPQTVSQSGAISLEDKTSDKAYPVYDFDKTSKCHRCQLCYILCPSYAIRFRKNPFELYVEKQFCTGCGICIEECPRKAIILKGRDIND